MKDSSIGVALLVGDDNSLLEELRPVVEAAGFTLAVDDPKSPASQSKLPRPSVALLCCEDGIESVSRLLDEEHLDDDVEVLLIGRAEQQALLQPWLSRGRAFFLGLPLDLHYVSQLLNDIRGELERTGDSAEALRSTNAPLDQFGLLLGSSKPIRRIYRLLRKVAPTDTPVLVCGESGTGKELVAATIHAASERNSGKFLAINCGAIPSELVESELFGHEKGSFTGAVKHHQGMFERADGGTLFLDEIAEMPSDVQVKLLRVLESGKFRRVGAEQDTGANVRIVAATNRTPEQAIASGKLRQDLYFRIAGFVIRMPPLRERGTDVVGLAHHFLSELNRQNGTSCGLSPEAERRLSKASWPGNVRELKNAIERAYLVADERIEASNLPGLAEGELAVESGDYLRVSVGASLDETERRLIFATLDAMNGNKSAAAEALGISLKTLYNRLNRYANDVQAGDAEGAGQG
ncbi:MAG TPA: sigma-54 dependent transcriptional regulator [Xanthomonadales bacterium]